MADMNTREKQALANGIVTLMSLARHSVSPTQTNMATRSAGNLLWLMGVEEYDYSGQTFKAIPPEGGTIDLGPTKLIEVTSHDR